MIESLSRINGTEPIHFEEAVEIFAHLPEANLQTYIYFAGDLKKRSEEKEKFLSDEPRFVNPNLDLTPIGLYELKEMSYRLQGNLGAVEVNVVADEQNSDAFYELVGQRAAETFFLLQAYRVNGKGLNQPERSTSALQLNELGLGIYGQPNEQDFLAIVDLQRQRAEELLGSDQSFIQDIAQEYLDLLPQVSDAGPSLFMPSEATVAHYHGLINEFYGGLMHSVSIDDDRKYTATDMAKTFRKGLQYFEAGEWKSEVEEGGSNIHVDHNNKTVWVGSKRAEASAENLRKLVVHELGVHVLRRLLGEQTDNPLLWNTGLSGYYTVEEGLGVVVEQALAGKAELRGVQHYANIGLALGIGQAKRF